MSEIHPDRDDLEQRLRAHYRQQFTAPPTPAEIWKRVADELDTPAQGVRHMTFSPESPSDAPLPQLPPFPQRRRVNYITGIISVAVIIVLALAAEFIFAGHQPTHPALHGTATTKPTQTVTGASASQNIVQGVSMISPTEGWAVGEHIVNNTQSGLQDGTVFIYHYTNGVWHPISISLPPDPHNQLPNSLYDVAMVNAHDGWAVGYADEDGLILHYDGTGWTRVPSPIHDTLGHIQMLSADEGWITSGGTNIYASASSSVSASLLHYSQGKWTVQYTLAGHSNSMLNSLSMVNTHEGWAVGIDFVDQRGSSSGPQPVSVILHYLNGVWQVQNSFPNAMLQTISMDSATDGWVAGSFQYTNQQLIPGLMYRYQGGQWHKVPNALSQTDGQQIPGEISDITMLNTNDGWLTLDFNFGASGNAYLYHYDGTTWSKVPVPVEQQSPKNILASISLFDVFFLPDGEGWAVGTVGMESAGNQYASTELILHYSNDQWSVQLS